MTMLAPVESLEDLWKLDFVEKMHEGKYCIRKEHETPEKAVSQAMCLACGRFCGYFCGPHEREYIVVMDRNQKGHWITCGHAGCEARNMISFMPL
jgi:hypothetical protein